MSAPVAEGQTTSRTHPAASREEEANSRKFRHPELYEPRHKAEVEDVATSEAEDEAGGLTVNRTRPRRTQNPRGNPYS